MIRFTALAGAQVTTEPFSYFCAADVLEPADLDAVSRDFPPISKPGLFPLSALHCDGAFAGLIEEVKSPRMAALIGEKFGMDLSDVALMITVRGFCQRRDGRIHTDSKDKLVSCLLYLNDQNWAGGGGRLRLFRDGGDRDSVVTEIPPLGGVFVAFKRSDNSWHGHAPFEGPRRYIMFNWLRSNAALVKNLGRHRISAAVKQFGGLDAGGA